jgi:hypothetical protein
MHITANATYHRVLSSGFLYECVSANYVLQVEITTIVRLMCSKISFMSKSMYY